mgnify:FL=1
MIQLEGRGMRCGKIILLGAEAKGYNKEYQEFSHGNF